MLCVAASGTILALVASSFSLSWTHSVERTLWQEHWTIEDKRLVLVEAIVEGSGAGIDLPADSVRTSEGWRYRPAIEPIERLSLAASGMTPSAWRLCTETACHDLGAEPADAITLWAADRCTAD
jgi:hypothetical protein